MSDAEDPGRFMLPRKRRPSASYRGVHPGVTMVDQRTCRAIGSGRAQTLSMCRQAPKAEGKGLCFFDGHTSLWKLTPAGQQLADGPNVPAMVC